MIKSHMLNHLAEGTGESYQLDNDAWNFDNKWKNLSCNHINYFDNLIDLFYKCKGNECRKLRFGYGLTNISFDEIIQKQHHFIKITFITMNVVNGNKVILIHIHQFKINL